MKHIDKVCSLEPKLFLISIYFIRIPNILEVITKTSFFKNRKMLNPAQVENYSPQTISNSSQN